MTTDNHKTVLCYGDSLTWGHICNGLRYPQKDRWTYLLGELLGNEYYIIEEGLRSRTTNIDDPDQADRNGFPYFRACYESHESIDYLIYFLGTNDTKTKFNRSAKDISKAAEEVLLWAKEYEKSRNFSAKVILVSPPLINLEHLKYTSSFDSSSNEKLKELAGEYCKLAQTNGYRLVDLSALMHGAENDGVHLTVKDNIVIAELLAQVVRGH